MSGHRSRRGAAGRLTVATGAGWVVDRQTVKPIADRGLPEWLGRDDGDTLYGIEAIAAYLALPFLDVRTMLAMGRLPARKAGLSHAARRSDLARHFLALEGQAVPHAAPSPPDIAPADALGLLSGQAAIATYLGCSPAGVRHRRARLGLHLFWIGKTPFARRASLDRWTDSVRAVSAAARRRAAIHERRRAAAPAGALIGAAEIAAFLGRTVKATHMLIHRAAIPVSRIGGGVVGNPAALAPFILPTRDDGELWGIPALARFLSVADATAARMVAEGQVPASRESNRWFMTRDAVARHVLAAERTAHPPGALAPAPSALADDALDLLQGQAAIGAYLGRSRRGVEYLRRTAGLPVFWIGSKPFARRASLDLWAAAQPATSAQERRAASRRANSVATAAAGAVVGTAAIGAALGITPGGVRQAIHRGRLHAYRAGPMWAADQRSINAYRKDRRHGQRQ